MKLLRLLLAAAAVVVFCSAKPAPEKVVVAYVTSWTDEMPDPGCVTHINYAFGHVNNTFNGVRIDNPERLKAIAALKKDNPGLIVMVSIGGWGSGRFSEMAADPKLRASFCADCKRVMDEFNLDGIDIDWEYPTNGKGANISESPDDTKNFTKLMKGIRKAIGKDAWLTLASADTPRYLDFPKFIKVMDLINLMSYDMDEEGTFHNALYPSEHTGSWTTDRAVKEHLKAGVPKKKLVVGIPFYGKGTKAYRGGRSFSRIYPISEEYVQCWDEKAMVPYLADKEGNFIFGYEDVRSAEIKCDYILENGLRGGMYWDYASNYPSCALSKLLASKLLFH